MVLDNLPKTVYLISKGVLDRDYRGCGKAWAAVKDGEIVALRYMGADRTPYDVPAWVKAVQADCEGIDERCLPDAWSSHGLAKLAAAAAACPDCPTPPRRARYRPKELLSMARAVLAAADETNFTDYRTRCRAELAAMGTVVSGMCSCTEFVLDCRSWLKVLD
jgi:hypothetical protein